MGNPVTEGGQILSPGEMAAHGFLPPGPLTQGVIKPGQPTANEQAIRDAVNPTPQSQLEPTGILKNARTVDPSEVTRIPSPLEYLAGNAKRNAPQIGGMIAAGAVPGAGAVTGPLMRTAAAGLGGAAGAAVSGGDMTKEGLLSAGGQAGGEIVGGLARAALNTPLYRKFAGDKAAELMASLKTKIPAWSGMPDNEKGLVQAMSLDGQRALSEAFDKSLQDVVAAGKGKPLAITASAAKKLGLETTGFIDKLPDQPGQQFVTVDAGAAAQAVTGKWSRDPGIYREVTAALDKADIGDPAARAAYKFGQGFRGFMDKTKALEGETFHPDRAMAGLMKLKQQGELGRRGMDETAGIIRGEGDKPVTARNVSPWERRLVGGTIGEIGSLLGGGHGFGLPFAGGAAAAEIAGPKAIYHNVPLGGAEAPLTAGPTGLGGLLRTLFGDQSGQR